MVMLPKGAAYSHSKAEIFNLMLYDPLIRFLILW